MFSLFLDIPPPEELQFSVSNAEEILGACPRIRNLKGII